MITGTTTPPYGYKRQRLWNLVLPEKRIESCKVGAVGRVSARETSCTQFLSQKSELMKEGSLISFYCYERLYDIVEEVTEVETLPSTIAENC